MFIKEGDIVMQERSTVGTRNRFGEKFLKESCNRLRGKDDPELVQRLLVDDRDFNLESENQKE